MVFGSGEPGVHYTLHRISGYIEFHRYDEKLDNPYDRLFRIREVDLMKILEQFELFLPFLLAKHLLSKKISYSRLIQSGWFIIPIDEKLIDEDSFIVRKRKKIKLNKDFLELDFSKLYYPIKDILKLNSQSFTLFSESLKPLGSLIRNAQSSHEFFHVNINSMKNFYIESLSILANIVERNEIKNKAKLKRLLIKLSKNFP